MSSNLITADNGASSGTTGIIQSAGSDGTLQLRTTTSGGTATTAVTIDNSQVATFANTLKAPNLQGPAFSAYMNTTQNISSSTFTVMILPNTEFNLGGCYNNTGSTATLNGLSVPAYAFCPNVAGYYQINIEIAYSVTVSGSLCSIAKNGSEFKRGLFFGTASCNTAVVSAIVYLNGTGDYVTALAYQQSGSTQTLEIGDTNHCNYFQAAMVRSA